MIMSLASKLIRDDKEEEIKKNQLKIDYSHYFLI